MLLATPFSAMRCGCRQLQSSLYDLRMEISIGGYENAITEMCGVSTRDIDVLYSLDFWVNEGRKLDRDVVLECK